jgi:glucan 1,3-beta-glucosidase
MPGLTLFSGFLIEGEGPNWLWGTASEHSVLYDYQIINGQNTWMGAIQHETAYYQGNPTPPAPFTPLPKYYDPDFSDCKKFNCARTWGLRILNSHNIYSYGSGHYMFFNNWDAPGCLGTDTCQERMVDLRNSTDIWLWGMATVGSEYFVSVEGTSLIPQAVNKGGFTENIVIFELTANQ